MQIIFNKEEEEKEKLENLVKFLRTLNQDELEEVNCFLLDYKKIKTRISPSN